MTSKYFTIEKTLFDKVRELAGTMPLDLPNYPLTAYPDNELWIAAHNLRGESVPVTLGDTGEDNHKGILQIDFNDSKNSGSGRILKKLDLIANFFTVGRVLRYNDIKITIRSCSASAGRTVGNYYRVSLSIEYATRTNRNL